MDTSGKPDRPQPVQAWIECFNAPGQSDEERRSLLAERFAAVGEDAIVRPPFFCDYGSNIFLGRGAFLNFHCFVLDVEPVIIGAGTAIGHCVQILASDHPRDPALRRQQLRFGAPVTIGENVWIGGGAIILPGVTIGDDAIIGAGSIVTRDVRPGLTVFGNPARARSSPPGGGERAILAPRRPPRQDSMTAMPAGGIDDQQRIARQKSGSVGEFPSDHQDPGIC